MTFRQFRSNHKISFVFHVCSLRQRGLYTLNLQLFEQACIRRNNMQVAGGAFFPYMINDARVRCVTKKNIFWFCMRKSKALTKAIALRLYETHPTGNAFEYSYIRLTAVTSDIK